MFWHDPDQGESRPRLRRKMVAGRRSIRLDGHAGAKYGTPRHRTILLVTNGCNPRLAIPGTAR